MNKLAFGFLFLLTTSLFGKIVEIKKAKEIPGHLQPDALIIFDIDNTIMHPAQELGNDQWFRHRYKEHTKQLRASDALQKTLNEWIAIQHVTSVRIVEEDIRDVIQDLQKKNLPLIGLTTRGYPMAHRTLEQLGSISVDLSATAPNKETLYFFEPEHVQKGVVYLGGILFTSGTHKGMTLGHYFQKIGLKPKRILFINDKLDHLEEVERYCQKEGIEFLGLRYGYLDEKVASFRPELADLQWKHFTSIPSDEEFAKKLPVKN